MLLCSQNKDFESCMARSVRPHIVSSRSSSCWSVQLPATSVDFLPPLRSMHTDPIDQRQRGRATCQPQTPAVPPSTYVQEMNFVSYPIRQTVPVVRFAGSTRPKVCYTRPNPLSISVWLCLSLWWSQKKNFLSPQENLLKVRVRVLGNGVAYLIACRGVKIYNYVLYKQ
jgi:hypothetical protein